MNEITENLSEVILILVQVKVIFDMAINQQEAKKEGICLMGLYVGPKQFFCIIIAWLNKRNVK